MGLEELVESREDDKNSSNCDDVIRITRTIKNLGFL